MSAAWWGALVLALCVAVGRAARCSRAARRLRDPYAALGPLPAHWRPVPRTVVRTHHLAPWAIRGVTGSGR